MHQTPGRVNPSAHRLVGIHVGARTRRNQLEGQSKTLDSVKACCDVASMTVLSARPVTLSTDQGIRLVGGR